ncbi:hypothetical protein [Trichothermofontia sp.]
MKSIAAIIVMWVVLSNGIVLMPDTPAQLHAKNFTCTRTKC